jgi:hypothetical protein
MPLGAAVDQLERLEAAVIAAGQFGAPLDRRPEAFESKRLRDPG